MNLIELKNINFISLLIILHLYSKILILYHNKIINASLKKKDLWSSLMDLGRKKFLKNSLKNILLTKAEKIAINDKNNLTIGLEIIFLITFYIINFFFNIY